MVGRGAMGNPFIFQEINDYIETGWWILKQAWSKGLLYEGMKGVPHCPRCVTSLSSHEVALGYRENTPDPSIYVKFPVRAGFFSTKTKPKAYDLLTQNETFATPTFFLAWTTTPWTMPGNTALGIAPTEDYVVAKIQGPLESEERLILAKALVSKVIDQDYVIETTIKGSAAGKIGSNLSRLTKCKTIYPPGMSQSKQF